MNLAPWPRTKADYGFAKRLRAPTIRNTDLTGLSTDEAIAFVHERMTREWAGELVQTRARMVRDGLSGEQIEALIEYERRMFERERDQHLDELRAALLAADKRLH